MISVVVLAYNSEDFIVECIGSVLHASVRQPDVEVIVLDNGSSDDTWNVMNRAFGDIGGVVLLRHAIGLGFAGGCNYAGMHARGEAILFLNDDCVVEVDCLQAIAMELVAAPQVGILQCAVATRDGNDWDTLGHFMDAWGFIYRVVADSLNAERDRVPAAGWRLFGASGAALVIRRALFEALGGFDEEFGFLFEESDLCWRALLLGAEVVGSGKAVVRHRQLARYNAPDCPAAFYLETRNRLRSLMKNFEALHAVAAVTAQVISRTMFAGWCAMKGQPGCVVDVIRAIGWNIRQGPSTWRARRRVQRTRCISDADLKSMGRLFRPRLQVLVSGKNRECDVARLARD